MITSKSLCQQPGNGVGQWAQAAACLRGPFAGPGYASLGFINEGEQGPARRHVEAPLGGGTELSD